MSASASTRMSSLGNAAVLVVDVQNDFVHPDGKVGEASNDVSSLLAAVDAVNRLIEVARRVGKPVVYIRVTHSPELDNDAYKARYSQRGMTVDDLLCADGSWGAELFEGLLPPEKNDLELTKHGYGAFASGVLEEHLRSISVDTVIVTGVVTELCVLGTVSGGFESGFHVVVPRETTASVDPRAAEAALALISGFYGSVVGLEEVITALENSEVEQVGVG